MVTFPNVVPRGVHERFASAQKLLRRSFLHEYRDLPGHRFRPRSVDVVDCEIPLPDGQPVFGYFADPTWPVRWAARSSLMTRTSFPGTSRFEHRPDT